MRPPCGKDVWEKAAPVFINLTHQGKGKMQHFKQKAVAHSADWLWPMPSWISSTTTTTTWTSVDFTNRESFFPGSFSFTIDPGVIFCCLRPLLLENCFWFWFIWFPVHEFSPSNCHQSQLFYIHTYDKQIHICTTLQNGTTSIYTMHYNRLGGKKPVKYF